MMTPSAVGVVLAGGRSTRFGSDKSTAVFRGVPLLDRALGLLAPCAARVVSARPGSAAERLALERGFSVLHDPPGGPDGPLAGIVQGLKWTQSAGFRWLVSLPCDVPLAPSDIAPRLLAAANGRFCSIARSGQDLHPLCAAWSTELLPRLHSATVRGSHPPIRRFVTEAGCGFVEIEATLMINANTPEDLARASQGGLSAEDEFHASDGENDTQDPDERRRVEPRSEKGPENSADSDRASVDWQLRRQRLDD